MVSGSLAVGVLVFAVLITNDRARLGLLRVELSFAMTTLAGACDRVDASLEISAIDVLDRQPHNLCTSGRPGMFDRDYVPELPAEPELVCGFVDEPATAFGSAEPFDFTAHGHYPCLCTPNAAGCLDVEMRALVGAYLEGYSDDLFRNLIARRPSELHAFARRFSGYADRDFMLSSRATPMVSRPRPDETAR